MPGLSASTATKISLAATIVSSGDRKPPTGRLPNAPDCHADYIRGARSSRFNGRDGLTRLVLMARR
jgi:hypothetical protein